MSDTIGEPAPDAEVARIAAENAERWADALDLLGDDWLGFGILGEVPECNDVCGPQGYGDGDDIFAYDRDCPIHGDFADQQEAPPAEGGKDITPPAGDVSESTGRTTTP